MALKVKKKEETVETTEKVEKFVGVNEEDIQDGVLTTEEVEAIQQNEKEDTENSADTRRLQLATNVVSKQFNLDPSYSVSRFDDKGKVVKLTLENKEFILDVTIKDSDRHGMYVEQ